MVSKHRVIVLKMQAPENLGALEITTCLSLVLQGVSLAKDTPTIRTLRGAGYTSKYSCVLPALHNIQVFDTVMSGPCLAAGLVTAV